MINSWEEIKNKAKKYSKTTDSAFDIYKKVSACGANQFYSIKPAYHLGSVYSSVMDYINYVEKMLNTKEKDFSEFFKTMIYLRECSKNMLMGINGLSEPLELLVQHMEEIYEGEEIEDEEDYEEYEDETGNAEGTQNEERQIKEKTYYREDFAKQREELKEKLRAKFKEVSDSENINAHLADAVSNIYLECVQFIRELTRLSFSADGDTDTVLTILVDIQFGLEFQFKNYITEDMSKEENYNFNLGFLIWSAHFLNELTNKLNKELVLA